MILEWFKFESGKRVFVNILPVRREFHGEFRWLSWGS